MNSEESYFSVALEDLENERHQKTAMHIWYEQLAAAERSRKRDEISETAMHMWQEQLAAAARHREPVEPWFLGCARGFRGSEAHESRKGGKAHGARAARRERKVRAREHAPGSTAAPVARAPDARGAGAGATAERGEREVLLLFRRDPKEVAFP